MEFNPGFDIRPVNDPMGFIYGDDCFGPKVENRTLDAIRPSLRNPACDGPQTVYSIAMDVGKIKHREQLIRQHLLFGVVMYNAGRLGDEPIRSQGHIHKISPYSQWSTPEVYEIWQGEGIIYMQENGDDDPGRCFAVHARPGEVVIVPPGWTHATISADATTPLVFGAWCDREYGFVYDKVRAHNGIAWFPLFDDKGKIIWEANPKYTPSRLCIKTPDPHPELGIVPGEAIYTTYERDNNAFDYVPQPGLKCGIWPGFIP